MPIFSRNPLLTEGESIQTESTLGEAFGAGFGCGSHHAAILSAR